MCEHDDEINLNSLIHRQFFSDYSLINFVIFCQKNSGAKSARKMKVKVTTGVHFTSFFEGTSQKFKKDSQVMHHCFFAFWILAQKNARKMLVKLTQGGNGKGKIGSKTISRGICLRYEVISNKTVKLNDLHHIYFLSYIYFQTHTYMLSLFLSPSHTHTLSLNFLKKNSNRVLVPNS